MKKSILVFFACLTIAAQAQNKFTPTDQFTIEGQVKQPMVLTIARLDTFKTRPLANVVISNHMGVVKNTLTGLKGILLKDILTGVSLQAENPKVLSEFYFIFVASDNYKVVFSWNELFNSETGNNCYIITEEGGKKIKEMDSRISILCTTDFKTGRRDLKNLQKIIVGRVN